MRAVRRGIQPVLTAAAQSFPAVVLTGPRLAGKTWLLRRLFPQADYVLLEDPDVLSRVRADPRGFLDSLEAGRRSRRPVILDEVQHLPEIFSFVRSRIDARPRETGRWRGQKRPNSGCPPTCRPTSKGTCERSRP